MMLQQMFGTQLAFPIRVAVAAIVIAALLGLTVLVMRRLAARSSGGERRGRVGPRLSVLDSIAVDQRRRLVLIRRDEVEHLLLIGGNSDIVIEQNIGGAEAAEAAPAPAAVAPPREAPGLQRPTPRRSLSASATPAALTAEPAAPGLPAPEPTLAEAPAAAPAESRDERRSVLGRRPLLRGDGTLSGRPAPRVTAADGTPEPATPRETARAEAPKIDAPKIEAPRPDQARLDALKAEFAADTPKIDLPKIDLPKADPSRVEQPRAEQPRLEPAKAEPLLFEAEDAPAAVSDVAAQLEDLSHRLDAALVQPPAAAAAPQLSLSDLLGDAPEAPAAPQPRTEPVIEAPPPARASEVRSSDGPLSRFLSQSRSRSGEPRPTEPRPEPRATEFRATVEPRPRLDAAPRPESPRTESPRAEAPLRPREFSFRSAGESRPLPAPEQPRREPLALRDVSRDEAPRPETASPLLRAPAPEVAAPVQAAPVHAAPPVVPAAAAPEAQDAPRAEPAAEAPRDPLDDFDAEMANLLGRTNSRGR